MAYDVLGAVGAETPNILKACPLRRGLYRSVGTGVVVAWLWHFTRFDVSTLVVLTIGHSTRSIEEFIRLLEMHGVRRVVDVRTIPKSRHNPQFNRDRLSNALHRARIHYSHLSGLGGLRRARRDSPNVGWRNASFRGYADYMQTARFRRSLERWIELATHERVVLMCAEAVPWRCHRSLIADALHARGIAVSEITSGVGTRPHALTPWALIKGTQVTYPGPTGTGVSGNARAHRQTSISSVSRHFSRARLASDGCPERDGRATRDN